MTNVLYQASCVKINGKTLLIRGKSGVGKSSLVLGLMDLGGQLISDDVTQLSVIDNTLIATPPDKLKGLLEVRALGILSVDYITNQSVDCVIDLIDETPDRMPPVNQIIDIMDIKLPFFQLKAFDFILTTKVLTIIKILNNKISRIGESK